MIRYTLREDAMSRIGCIRLSFAGAAAVLS